MNKGKRLIRDIILFAIASFGPKMISFFLVPLYTSLLSTEAYGTADLLNTIYTLLLPILTLDISDAIMIYTIEKKDDQNEAEMPMKIGSRILAISSVILCICLIIICLIFRNERVYACCGYILFQFVNHALYNNYLAYLRGKDRVQVIVTASIISSVGITLFNVLFILVLKWGLIGFLLGNFVGVLVADIYILFRASRREHFLSWKSGYNIELQKQMIRYSAPLIFTGIAWWVNGSSDRLFISALAGVSLNGIYAVANKIPSILNACHSVVYQALQLSVFAEVHADNDKNYLKQLYNIYNAVMVLVASVLILFDIPLAKLLFKKDFFTAWHYVPALLISTVMFSVSGYVTTIAAASKNTKLIAQSTITGAIINTILNIILIPRFQVYGAVIATIAGYFVIWAFIVIGTMKEVNVKLNIFRSIIMYSLLFLQWIIILYSAHHYVLNTAILVTLIILNSQEIIGVIKLMTRLFASKLRRKQNS